MPVHRRGCVCPKCSAPLRGHARPLPRAVQLDAFISIPPRAPPPKPAPAPAPRPVVVKPKERPPAPRLPRYVTTRVLVEPRDPRTLRLRELLRAGVPMPKALEQIENEWSTRP